MIDKNGKVMKMTPTKRKEYLAQKLDLPRTPRGLGKDLTTKDIISHLFKKEVRNIMDTLETIRDIDPRTYLRTMIDLGKLSIIAEKDLDSDKRFTNDIKDLEALRDRKIPKVNTEAIENYVEYKEVKEEPISETPVPTSEMSHPAIKEDLRELGLPPIPKLK